MPATDFFETLILNHALRQQPFSVADWYVGLWKADPTAAGLLTDEVDGADYQRQPVVWDTAFSNTALIVWAAAQNNWGIITYMCVLNSPTKTAGNMLGYQLRGDMTIGPGVSVEIPAGGLAWAAA